jgi:alpha-beta hydrolase superfamily lysophospholipase
MKHETGEFQGARGVNIFYQCWLPEDDAKAVLLVVHGIGEHSGRYMNLVNHFTPLGYAVYGLDHIGHGRSDGTRVFVERFGDFTETLKTFFDMVRGWQPGRPVFLVGHSLGGLIGSVFLLEHQDELAGAVLSAPSIKLSESISQLTLFSARVLSNIAPKLGLTSVDVTAVSSDPAVVQAYLDDPLVYKGKATVRLAAEGIKAIERVTRDVAQIRLPLLIVQGSADHLVEPDGAKMLYEQSASTDKTYKIYDGFYHEVMNEPGRTQVLGDMQAWFEARLA